MNIIIRLFNSRANLFKELCFNLCSNLGYSMVQMKENKIVYIQFRLIINPFMPTGAFNICCPRDCVSRHNGGTSGTSLKPLRVDSALRALSTLRGSHVGT